MAQIINKRTPAIIANRRPTGLNYVSVNERNIYFPKTVSHLVGAANGKYIHFINDQDYWAFFINDDPDGFLFNQDKAGSYKVSDRALAKMFLRSTGKKVKSRFFVSKSSATQTGNDVWEIYTKETADVVMNKDKEIKAIRKRVLNTVKNKSASPNKGLNERK